MRTRILGLVAGVALLGGSAALAQDSANQQQVQGQDMQTATGRTTAKPNEGGRATVTVEKDAQGTGGAGQSSQSAQGQQGDQMKSGQGQQGAAAGASASAEAESSLTGTVVKADKSTLFVRTQEGAVVPLKVDKKTQFADPSLKSAKDLKEGQQVRASFTVKKTDNLATRLEALGGSAQGTGGAGSSDSASGSSASQSSGSASQWGNSAAGTAGNVGTEPGPSSQVGSGTGNTPDDAKQKK